MKIKMDFITVSSSTAFVLSIDPQEYEDFEIFLKELNTMQEAANEGCSMSLSAETMKELNEYTNDGPLDWAQKPTGVKFKMLAEKQYKICKNIIQEGNIAVICWIDYNACEIFEDNCKYQIVDTFS